MPWVKKPVLLGGIIALLLGALAGGLLNNDHFNEYALSAAGLSGVKEQWSPLKAPALKATVENDTQVVTLPEQPARAPQTQWQTLGAGWLTSATGFNIPTTMRPTHYGVRRRP